MRKFDAITSDPAFADLTPDEQRQVLADVQAPKARPRSVVEKPRPATSPLDPYLAPPPPTRPASQPAATLPAPMKPKPSDPEAQLARQEAKGKRPAPAPAKKPAPRRPPDKGRQAFREFVKANPDYWALPASAREQVMSRYIDLGGAGPVDTVSNPLEAFGRSLMDEGINNTLPGAVARAGKRGLTGDGSEFQVGNEFYAEGPLAEAAGYLGRVGGQLLDPTNLIPIAKGAQVARGVMPAAGQGLGAVAKQVGQAAAKGAAPGALMGGTFGGTFAAADQYANTGEFDLGSTAQGAAVGGLLGGTLGAALPVAKALPSGRFNPNLPGVNTQGLATTGQRLVDQEAGTFDPSRALRISKQIREAVIERNRARAAGDTQRATQLQQRIDSLKDARTVLEARPPEASSLAPPTRYYNERKYNFATPESRAKFDELTRQVVHERGLNPKQRIPNAEILRRAREMTGSNVDDLKYKDLKFGESLSAVEYEAAKNVVDNLKERAVVLERDLNALPATTPPETRRGMELELNSIERDIKGFMGVLIPSRSQKGRDLAYLKMIAQQGWDDTYWTARAARVSGTPYDPALPNYRELDAIVRRGREADQAADQAGVRQARIDLAKFMGRLERTPPDEALLAFRKAGLLSGVKTIARNMSSNTINAVTEEVVRMPAAVVDAGLSMLTGRRTVLAPTPGKVAQGLHSVATKGVNEFRETMVHGIPLEQLANLEVQKEINTGIGPLDSYINGVFRFQNAQDRLFKAYAYTRSLRDQAELLVRRDGTPPAQRAARVQAIVENPNSVLDRPRADELVREAIADAEFTTFTNDTPIASAVSRFKGELKKSQTGRGVHFLVDMIMPFVKTPSAVISRVMEFATLGVTGAPRQVATARMGEAWRTRELAPLVQALTPAEQKAISMGISRGMVGASLMYMGGALAREGLMTGTWEPDKTEEYAASGRMPASIKINGQWVPIGMLSPVGNLLVLGATLERDGWSPVAYAAGVIRTGLDQPMTQGFKQVADVMKPDQEGITKAMGKMAGNMASSWVPTIAGEFAQALDPQGVDREVSRTYPQSAVDGIRKKLPVPGGRGALPEKRTALGDTIPVPSGPWAFWAFSGKPAREDNDPVLRELLDRDVNLPKPTKRVRLDGQSIDLTERQARDLWNRQGPVVRQVITDLITAPGFPDYEPGQQDEALEEAIREARAAVKDEWIEENYEALAGAAHTEE